MHRVRCSVRENTPDDDEVLTPERDRAHLEERGRGWIHERALS